MLKTNMLCTLLVTSLLSFPVLAERKVSFDDTDIHYNVFNSSFLQPKIAASYEIVRSKKKGVINIAVLKKGKAVTSTISGSFKNLLGQTTPLHFKQIIENKAIYQLAQFPITQQERLTFNIQVKVSKEQTHQFNFDQEVFPDL